MTFGKRVKEARKRAQLSQEALARRAGMSLPGVAKIEQGGVTDPHYSTLHRLAEALDVNPLWLVAGEEVEGPAHAGKAEAPPLPAPVEEAEEERRKIAVGPGSEELRRAAYELKPGTPVEEALEKLSPAGEGALGIALADLFFGGWSDDEASNSAAHQAASRFAAKTNTDLPTLLNRMVTNRVFLARRVESARPQEPVCKEGDEAGEEAG